MMRSQRVGGRYLAGFVMGAAIVYLALTGTATAMAWRDSYPPWLLANFLTLGLVPSLAALALGIRAWSSNSAALCAIALVLLILAIALWRLFVVSF